MRSVSYPYLHTRWDTVPLVNIQALSCPQETVTIRIPKGMYVVGSPSASPKMMEIDATFFIGTELTGTPMQVAQMIGRNSIVTGELARYTDGNNHWLLSREACIINGAVAFIVLPSPEKTFLVGTCLMENTSRMAKVFKEKIIPDIVLFYGNGATVKIMDTFSFTVRRGTPPTRIVTDDSIKDVLLEHIEEEF